MRISDKFVFQKAQFNIRKNRESLAEHQEVVATGRRINRISDSPEDISRIHLFRNRLEKFKSFTKNIERGNTMLDGAETSLAEVGNLLTRVKELVIQGSNGTISQDGMNGIAKEIESNRALIMGLANTKIDNSYVFAGYKNDIKPFNDDGSFNGDTNSINVEIGEGVYESINTDGQSTFIGDPNTGTLNVFTELEDLNTALKNGDKTLVRSFLGKVDTMLSQVGQARADLGTKQNKLEISQNILSKLELDTKSSLSTLEDADIVTAISEFNQAEKSLMASLSASAKLVDKSLLNYL